MGILCHRWLRNRSWAVDPGLAALTAFFLRRTDVRSRRAIIFAQWSSWEVRALYRTACTAVGNKLREQWGRQRRCETLPWVLLGQRRGCNSGCGGWPSKEGSDMGKGREGQIKIFEHCAGCKCGVMWLWKLSRQQSSGREDMLHSQVNPTQKTSTTCLSKEVHPFIQGHQYSHHRWTFLPSMTLNIHWDRGD